MNNSSKVTLKELKQIAKIKNLKNYSNLNKKDLIKHIGGEGFLSSLSKYVPFRSKNSPKIETNNIGVYNPSPLKLSNRVLNNSKLPIAKPIQINANSIINNMQSAIIVGNNNNLEIESHNLIKPMNATIINETKQNNNENKKKNLTMKNQILNMNSSNAIIYFSEDIIKKLIDFTLKLIKDNIKEIATIAQISAFIRYEDLLSVNKNLIDKMIADINASYLMKGTNKKLIQLTSILLKNLKDLKKLISIKNLKNNTLQKNINSFSSNEIKNYIKKISSNITPTSNMKTIQRKMKIRTNLQERLTKLPK